MWRKHLPRGIDIVLLTATLITPLSTTTAQDCFPAPEGLVSWWPGDGDASDIQDGNDGNLVNGTAFAPGHVEEAFQFDSVNDYVFIGNPSNLDISGDLTIEFWFRVDVSKYNVLVAKGIGLSGNEWWVRHRGDGGGFLQAGFQDMELDFVQVDTTATIDPGSFHHLAWVRDESTGRLYVDGVEIGSATNSALGDIRNPHDLIFGADNRLRTDDFAAVTMDEISYFNRALFPAEIVAIFDAGILGKCKDEDGDGFRAPDDCDDTDPAINPDAQEIIFNFVDENCDGNLGDCDPASRGAIMASTFDVSPMPSAIAACTTSRQRRQMPSSVPRLDQASARRGLCHRSAFHRRCISERLGGYG